jgi:competence protein ComGC
MVKRAAFTFIELIFAIVIIAITIVSLPMMNQVLSKNVDSNLIQEAIFAAATELNEVTSVHWDENSTEENSTNDLAKVINIDSTCEDNATKDRFRLRSGHILEPLHRRCLNDLDRNETRSNTNDDVDAVEDTAHASRSIFIDSSPSAEGYKNDYNSTITISYDPVFDGTQRPNMKKITSTITDSSGKTIVKLNTYVANIGEVDFYKRSF